MDEGYSLILTLSTPQILTENMRFLGIHIPMYLVFDPLKGFQKIPSSLSVPD